MHYHINDSCLFGLHIFGISLLIEFISTCHASSTYLFLLCFWSILLTHVKFQDSSSFVRRLFLDKTHKLLKDHAIPIRYACAFALAASDHCKDLQDAVCFFPTSVWLSYNITNYSSISADVN